MAVGIPQVLVQFPGLDLRRGQALSGHGDGLMIVRQCLGQVVPAVEQTRPRRQGHRRPALHGPQSVVIRQPQQGILVIILVIVRLLQAIRGDLGVLPLINRVLPGTGHRDRPVQVRLIRRQVGLILSANVQVKGRDLFHPILEQGAEDHAAPF